MLGIVQIFINNKQANKVKYKTVLNNYIENSYF